MNLNTRSKTITLSPTEKGWLEEIKGLAAAVAMQPFVQPDDVKACETLRLAINEFKGVMAGLAPVKKPKQKTRTETRHETNVLDGAR